jgi:putative ABC transport system permease protein
MVRYRRADVALSLPVRFALRELRGGVRGFRIFIACIAIGVAAIAGAVSLNDAVKAGIAADAQPLLGGDAQVRIGARPIGDIELAAVKRAGDVSVQLSLRSMARAEDASGATRARTLVELKAVDNVYPLYGAIELNPPQALETALAQRDGVWGAVIDASLLTRLQVALGDMIKVGEATVQLRAVIAKEPDRAVSFATAGPRLMIAMDAVPETQLVQVGSLVEYKYNVRLTGSETTEALRARLTREFPDAGWRVRGLNQAAQGLDGFLDNVTLFLTLVGLTALLTGGIGVANAVRAHLAGRMNTIATLKCLGARGDDIFAIYLIQMALLAAVGIAIGVIVGAAIPFAADIGLAGLLPVKIVFGVYPLALLEAAIFGVLTTAVFGVWPLARARDIAPVALFRSVVDQRGTWPQKKYVVAIALIAVGLAAFTILTADQSRFAVYFVLGAGAALILFRLAAQLVIKLAKALTASRQSFVVGRPSLRLALANLHRPGAPTATVVLSLGLGLSVLVAVALLQTNLNAQIKNGLPSDAPSMFFIDIQRDQVERFTASVKAIGGVDKVITSAMIRGRVTKINDVPAEQAQIAPSSRWAVRGERGLSYAATLPENARLTAGKWWPADYSGENLVSLDAEVARDFQVGVGDTLTVNVLGHEITARIASLRDIRWQSATMNFTLVFSPNALAGAPGMYIATVNSAPGTEETIEATVVDAMPNITVIQVREALELMKSVLGTLGVAVRLTAAVALVAGVLVLAGAIAAGQARRIYESVVLKVLGATRGDVLKAFVFEYLLLGLSAGVIAAAVGTIAAWAVVEFVMRISWTLDPTLIVGVITACVALTLVAGFTGTWRAMGTKAATHLRND